MIKNVCHAQLGEWMRRDGEGTKRGKVDTMVRMGPKRWVGEGKGGKEGARAKARNYQSSARRMISARLEKGGEKK